MSTCFSIPEQLKLAVRLAWLFLGVGSAVGQPHISPLIQSQWPGFRRGAARAVDVVGSYAYVADNEAGLQVIDVSDPTNPVRVGRYNSRGDARGVFVSDSTIYVADGWDGLLALHSVPNVQFAVQVDAPLDTPFTIEAASDLTLPIQWTPLLTTNSATMPFCFTDFEVRGVGNKFYRVVEP